MSRFKAKALFFRTLLSRRGFSSSPSSSSSSAAVGVPKKLPQVKFVKSIHTKYKRVALEEAQRALRDYLHSTKSLPFLFAELIANNSLFCVADLFTRIHFCPATFAASFRNRLCFEPINEFEFFLESIGVPYHDVRRYLPPKTLFFSQDSTVLVAACALSRFGFPWNMIGKLCVEDLSILQNSPEALLERLSGLKERHGLDNLTLVGIILAFPYLLSLEEKVGCKEEILDGLKRAFSGFGLENCVEGDVKAWYEVCLKVRVFFDLGCHKKRAVELMCENREHFLRCPLEVLIRKVEYFCKFGVQKAGVGLLILQRPELLSVDLETPTISVLGFLEHFGLEGNELKRVNQKFAHCFGRNEMANLPNIMKALDLHDWCFEKIKSSNGHLLETYAISFPEEGIDKGFVAGWNKIDSLRFSAYIATKLKFLKGIGFGENVLTLQVLSHLNGVRSDLQARFDRLVFLGFEHPRLCSMLKRAPLILNQSAEILEEKVNFCVRDMGFSLSFLFAWPKYLYHSNFRIRRRYGVYVWLRDLGLCNTYHSFPKMIECSEKRFVEKLYRIHPASPKHYFECF